jgi:hypothetical protein
MSHPDDSPPGPESTRTASSSRSRRRWRVDWTDDRGQVGGIEVLPFAILIFVIGALLVTNAWAVIDVKMAVNAATREGARTAAEARDKDDAANGSQTAAHDAITAYGRDRGSLNVDPPDYHGGTFGRCNLVTITARYPVPFITLPLIGTHGQAFTVSSSHTEIVDPFRSGLQGKTAC